MKWLLVFFLTMLSAHSAQAKTWVTDYGKSSLGFIANQNGQPLKGQFKKFEATINFDANNLGASSITAKIDIASAITGNADADGSLPQGDWFNTSKFPQAEFATSSIEAGAKPSCYKAKATLTLKGVTKNVDLPFCLMPDRDTMHAEGELTLSRKDFGIGVGQWAAESVVANPVIVNVDIIAK